MSFSPTLRWLSIPLALGLVLGLWPMVMASSPAIQGSQEPVSTPANTSTLLFIENVGQFHPEARFQVRGANEGTLWLADPSAGSGPPALWVSLRGCNLKLSFPGANPRPRLEPFDRLPTAVNYYHGNDPAHWYTNVPVWGGVRYVDLYPGVDLEITGQDNHWTWRLVAKTPSPALPLPGGGSEGGGVRLRVEGADDVTLDGATLRLSTAVGDLALPLPAAPDAALSGQATVQHTAPETFDVTSPFAAPATPHASRLTNHALQDNPDHLLFSTFLGADDNDKAYGLAVDGDGETYVTGNTYSPGFPTTPGAFDPSFDGENEMFVTRLNASGSGLVYSTFLGGTVDAGDPPDERAWDIAVDGDGAAYITGETRSDDFPTTPGAFDTTYNPGYALPGEPPEANPFVTKLDSSGSLAYSTYLGPSSEGKGIAVDGAGMIYVTGRTGSEWFPTTDGAYDRSLAFSGDFFVLKLNPAGQGQSDLLYSTYVGLEAQDFPQDIAIDEAGVVYVIGYTQGEFPTTAGAYNTTSGSVVFFKLNPAGNGAADLLYSTYLGTGLNEYGWGIAVDAAGVVYLTGGTESADWPTTPGAFDTTHNGFGDVFVSKLNPAGNGAADLLYSTYLGGWYIDNGGYAIAVDDAGDIYVVGDTYSEGFPTTPDAFQVTKQSYPDLFVTRLRPQGAGAADLVYSTYLGGNDMDYGRGIVVGSGETIYIAGYTRSSDFPITAGAYDTTFGGGTCGSYPCYDAFVAKLQVKHSYIIVDKVTDPSDDPQSFTFTTTGTGYTGFSLTDADTPNDQQLVPGDYSVSETVPGGWDLSDLGCSSALGTSTIDTTSPPTATITLAAGDTVTCTFTNTEITGAGMIIIEKVTDPAGGTGFGFTDDIEAPNNFPLNHGGTKTFLNVAPATYTVTEDDPTVTPGGYDLTGLTCVEDGTNNSTTDLGARKAAINLDPGETVTCTFTNTRLAGPTGGSTDSVGVGQDTYTTGEVVYGTGSGFTPNTDVDVYIVGDRAWNDGDAIPTDVSSDGMNPAVPTDAAGDLGPANVWPPPLTPGEYDMVFDANRNGTYDAAIDAVDHPAHPGFVIQAPPPPPIPVGGVIAPVNRLELLAPWLGLATLAALAALGFALVRRRRA